MDKHLRINGDIARSPVVVEIARSLPAICAPDVHIAVTVNALIRLWGFAVATGRKSGNDIVLGVCNSKETVNNIAGAAIAEGMEKAGWLRFEASGARFPGLAKKNSAGSPATAANRKHYSTSYPELFAKWWDAYPKHVSKAPARTAFDSALQSVMEERGVPVEQAAAFLTHRAAEFAKTRKPEDSQFTPYPATWLNKEMYYDVIGTRQPHNKKVVPVFTETGTPASAAAREWQRKLAGGGK